MAQKSGHLDTLFNKAKLRAPDTRPLEDAVSMYSDNNEELLRNNEVLATVFYFLCNKLFSKGVSFLREGELMVPTGEFGTIVDHHWTPFLRKCLRFILCRGFLVWFIAPNPKGFVVPDVPDIMDIEYRLVTNEKSSQTDVEASWRDEGRHNTQLYVFNNSSPYGITPENCNSQVDSAKNLIRMLNVSAMNEEISCHNNSRAPIMLEHPIRVGPHNTDTANVNLDDPVGEMWMRKIETYGNDDISIGRIKRMQDAAAGTYVNLSGAPGATPAWKRAQQACDIRPEKRFVTPPFGMVFKGTIELQGDPNWMKKRQMLVEEIYNLFGIPYSALMTSTAQISSTGIDLHKTMLLQTLEMWWMAFSTLLTDVYRVIHDPAHIMAANVQQTAAEEEMKLIDMGQLDSTPKILRTIESQLIRKNFKPKALEVTAGEERYATNYNRYLITVELSSRFSISPEQCFAVFHEGVLEWDTFKRLRLQSIGLPAFMASSKTKEPLRINAKTLEEEVLLNTKQDSDGNPSPPKKAKMSPSSSS